MKRTKTPFFLAYLMTVLMLASCTKLLNPSLTITVTDITATSAAVHYDIEDSGKLKSFTETLSSDDESSHGLSGRTLWSRAINGSDISIEELGYVYDNLSPDTEYILESRVKVGLGVAEGEVSFRTLPDGI